MLNTAPESMSASCNAMPERLERRLDDVMTIVAAEHADVNGCVRVIGERAKPVVVQRARKRAAIVRPAAEVDGDFDERVVHRHDAMAVARARRGCVVRERRAKRDPDVLDQVMLQVPDRLKREIEPRVSRERDHHVIEESKPGRYRRSSIAARDLEADARLRRFSFDDAHSANSSAACHGSMAPV